jgi:hypothetical protein
MQSDLPKTQFEKRVLESVLAEAKAREIAVPSPYSFRISKDKLTFEMKGTIEVWDVEIFPKSGRNSPTIVAQLDITNYQVIVISQFK